MELEEGQASLLEFKKENVKELAQIVKSLLFREFCVIYPFSRGLKITVDDNSCQQANAFMEANIFSCFTARDNNIKLRVPIKTLSECLNICEGTTSSVKITYSGFYEPLRLLLEEADGAVIRAKIHTTVPEQELDFEFDDASVVATCMMKTQLLKDIFKEFDTTSEYVQVKFTPNEMVFTTKGEIGDIVVSIPTRSLQLEMMKCEVTTAYNYKMSLIQRMNPVFALASKIVLRVDDRGVLCCQFTVDHGDSKHTYVEFLTVPDEDDADL